MDTVCNKHSTVSAMEGDAVYRERTGLLGAARERLVGLYREHPRRMNGQQHRSHQQTPLDCAAAAALRTPLSS